MTTSEPVIAAYHQHLGEPAGAVWFGEGDVQVSVLRYDPSPATGGVTLYLTAGASEFPQPGQDPAHRLEFYLGLAPAADTVARSLAWLGALAPLSGNPVGAGHTWRADQPVIDGYDFAGLIVADTDEPMVPPLALAGVHVTFLMAAPLFTDELDYVRAHGSAALWDRMDEADVPIWDPRRASTFAGLSR